LGSDGVPVMLSFVVSESLCAVGVGSMSSMVESIPFIWRQVSMNLEQVPDDVEDEDVHLVTVLDPFDSAADSDSVAGRVNRWWLAETRRHFAHASKGMIEIEQNLIF
jgi:hypothetical protein